MKYLCLAYGDGKVFENLSRTEQEKLFAQDELIRNRGAMMATVGAATTVTSVDGKTSTTGGPFAVAKVPFVGFSIIEARDMNAVVELVSKTPCAVAGGAIEVWPLTDHHGQDPRTSS